MCFPKNLEMKNLKIKLLREWHYWKEKTVTFGFPFAAEFTAWLENQLFIHFIHHFFCKDDNNIWQVSVIVLNFFFILLYFYFFFQHETIGWSRLAGHRQIYHSHELHFGSQKKNRSPPQVNWFRLCTTTIKNCTRPDWVVLKRREECGASIKDEAKVRACAPLCDVYQVARRLPSEKDVL